MLWKYICNKKWRLWTFVLKVSRCIYTPWILFLCREERLECGFYPCDILKCNVICIPLILSSKNIETWQVKKDFNIPNDVGRVQTYLIKFICWEINFLRFYVKIYRIDDAKSMYYIWIHRCSKFSHTQAIYYDKNL
jgi:hypothetical protein